MLKATFNDEYDGICIHDRFYTESSQLLDVIKNNNTHPNVSGGLLPTVKDEYRFKLVMSVLYDLNTVAGMQQIVRNVVKRQAILVAGDDDEKASKLQKDYLEIVEYKDRPMRHKSDLRGLNPLGAEIPPEIVYLRNFYSVLPVADIKWKEIRDFQDKKEYKRIMWILMKKLSNGIAEYTNRHGKAANRKSRTINRAPLSGYKEEELWEMIETSIESTSDWWRYSLPDETAIDYASKMSETEEGLEPIEIRKDQLYYDSESRVKEMFENLIGPRKAIIKKMEKILKSKDEEEIRKKMNTLKNDNKDKLPPQLFEHIKSIAEKHSHENDILILTETVTHKTQVDDSRQNIPEMITKFYIASTDMRFFSPLVWMDWEGNIEVDDSTITQHIQKEFEITCDNPRQILEILYIPLNDS
ncbi:MAG: hypothetical protein OXC46_04440 [Thaumarchaeota archaeon]|nr:hypothetical protein [Nitrososphaerota archaeon]